MHILTQITDWKNKTLHNYTWIPTTSASQYIFPPFLRHWNAFVEHSFTKRAQQDIGEFVVTQVLFLVLQLLCFEQFSPHYVSNFFPIFVLLYMDCDLSIIIYDFLIVSHLNGLLHSGNLILLGTWAYCGPEGTNSISLSSCSCQMLTQSFRESSAVIIFNSFFSILHN